jgi:hypothetical protein
MAAAVSLNAGSRIIFRSGIIPSSSLTAAACTSFVAIKILSADTIGNTLSTVIRIKLRSLSISLNSCFGLSLVDNGQNLSPDPPAIIRIVRFIL